MKPKVLTIPTDWTPIGKLELLPGDVCDVEDGGALTTGRLYLEQVAGSAAFDSGDRSRFWWPTPAARVRITRSPNRERKAEKSDRDVVDPVLALVADAPSSRPDGAELQLAIAEEPAPSRPSASSNRHR